MITVAAAIIENEKNEILICRRADKGNCAGLWEFPGGKLEEGETLEACVVRECREELGITIEVTSVFDAFTYRYPDSEIQFVFYRAALISGPITANVHQQICWAKRKALKNFEFCPADIGLIKRLQEMENGQDN